MTTVSQPIGCVAAAPVGKGTIRPAWLRLTHRTNAIVVLIMVTSGCRCTTQRQFLKPSIFPGPFAG
jgi:hypothetical protein